MKQTKFKFPSCFINIRYRYCGTTKLSSFNSICLICSLLLFQNKTRNLFTFQVVHFESGIRRRSSFENYYFPRN